MVRICIAALRVWRRLLLDELKFVQAIAVVCVHTHQSPDWVTLFQRCLIDKFVMFSVPCLVNLICKLLKARLKLNLGITILFEVPLNSSLTPVIFNVDRSFSWKICFGIYLTDAICVIFSVIERNYVLWHLEEDGLVFSRDNSKRLGLVIEVEHVLKVCREHGWKACDCQC